jgi:CRISPR/Cas system CMR-associated protein Cmr5 small subunit
MIEDAQAKEVLAVTLWLINNDNISNVENIDLSALCETWRNDEKLREHWRSIAVKFDSLAEKHGLKLAYYSAKINKVVDIILTTPARKAYTL